MLENKMPAPKVKAPKRRDGEVAVITGGAGGIGAACAESWIAQGGKVIACDINEKLGRDFESRYPGKVKFLVCDTRNRSHLEAAATEAKKLGALTCWMNNAGVRTDVDSLSDALDDFGAIQKVIDINVTACTLGAYIAMNSFDADRGGVIITTASIAGLLPQQMGQIYAMSKAANIHFTRSAATELGEDSNIRIYTLCPSFTATAIAPTPEQIKAMLGGVLTVKHQAEGFMMLAEGNLPNGSTMRVTQRNRGSIVVHDLVAYGKELGGPEDQRPGYLLKSQPLEEFTDKDNGLTSVADFIDASKL